MRLAILTALLFAGSFSSYSQELSVSSIDPSLREGVDAVVRAKIGVFEITSIRSATYTYKEVVTIFNKAGEHNAVVGTWYDKLVRLGSISASKYDEDGNRTYKSRPDHFFDESATDRVTFYDDNRIRWLDLTQDKFPYTIEFEYKLNFKYLFHIPDWEFVPNINESVEYSQYKVISPKGLSPSYFSHNVADPVIEEEQNTRTLTWELSNQPGNQYEPYSGALSDYAPYVSVSPSFFEFEGYRGDLSSWDGMAHWQNRLNEGLEVLSEETIAQVRKLTAGRPELEKARLIYEYVQSKTRYVGIQLGIGGFQPFSAQFVDEHGYGDCKALSFYTQSLLKEVGVTSHYSWVYGGDNPPKVNEQFPDDSFNHIILCLPLEGDTVWLECTSQTNPFGYLGEFTGDRKALVMSENGGKVVNTTSYDIDDNVKYTNATVSIDEEGHALVKLANVHKGLKYEEDDLNWYLTYGESEQQKWLEKTLSIPSFTLTDFALKNNKDVVPSALVQANLSVNRLVSKSGSRFFLQPNLLNKSHFMPVKNDSRTRPILLDHPFREYDSIVYSLPAGHIVEAYFKPVEIESEFGLYKASIERVDDQSFVYKRELHVFEGEFPNTSYPNFLEFHKQVVRSDKKRISFKRKT